MPKHKQVTTCLRDPSAPTSNYCSCYHCTLAVCSVCGCYEGSLTTDCPGYKLDQAQQDRVYKDGADYRDGHGWHFTTASKSPRFEEPAKPLVSASKQLWNCCALGCRRTTTHKALPFCDEHMKDAALMKAWEEL